MNFIQRIIANSGLPQQQPQVSPSQQQVAADPESTEDKDVGGPEWVAVKPYEYDSDSKRMCILINPKDPFASSTSNLVFAEFTGNTLDFGIKWFIGGQDDTLNIKFADGLDIDQVNYFYKKHQVPVDITIREICYLLTGIEDGIKQGPGGAPDENPQAPMEQDSMGHRPGPGPELDAKPGPGNGSGPAPGPSTSNPGQMFGLGMDPNRIGQRKV